MTGARAVPRLAAAVLAVLLASLVAQPAGSAAGAMAGVTTRSALRTPDPADEPGTFRPVQTWRVLDTRNGIGAPVSPVAGRTSVDVTVTGRASIPDTGV